MITYEKMMDRFEVSKSRKMIHWYRSNFNVNVLRRKEIRRIFNIPFKMFKEILEKIPSFYNVEYMHRSAVYSLLTALQEVTLGASLRFWDVVKHKFYTLTTKWQVPFVQAEDEKLYLSLEQLERFEIYPSQEDIATISIGNRTWVRARSLRTTDEEYNRFIDLLNVSKIKTVDDFLDVQNFVQSGVDLDSVLSQMQLQRLRNRCEVLVSENNQLQHNLDTPFSSENVEELKNSLRMYVIEMDIKLSTQSTLLRAASEDLKRRDNTWNHAFFMQYFDNSAIVAVMNVAYEQIKNLGMDCSLYSIQQFIREQCGKYRVDMRRLIETAQQITE